jgi:hypothetical protein
MRTRQSQRTQLRAETAGSAMRTLTHTCVRIRMNRGKLTHNHNRYANAQTHLRAHTHAYQQAYADARTARTAMRTLQHTCAGIRMHPSRLAQMRALS